MKHSSSLPSPNDSSQPQSFSPKLNPPVDTVPLNSAENLFTRKLKHCIGVVQEAVLAEKQGNYLESEPRE